MIDSRAKGANGEREFAKLIDAMLGVRLERNLQQTRDGGHDLHAVELTTGPAVVLSKFAIEVKRWAGISAAMVRPMWWQAVEQAHAVQKIPLLAYRGDRGPWRIVLPMAVLGGTATFDELRGCVYDHTMEISVEGFCRLVKQLDSRGYGTIRFSFVTSENLA